MKRTMIASILATAALATIGSPGLAEKKKKPPQVAGLTPGRTPMADPEPVAPLPPPAPTTTLAQGISASANHATFLRLINGTPLAGTLAAPGAYTVFAPSDDAFARLAPGTVDKLLDPGNLASLTSILKYHVVSGALTVDEIKARIVAGGGTAPLPTLQGGVLTATKAGEALLLTDQNGNKSYVSQPDLKESNGVIQVVNGVVLPKQG